MDCKHNFRFMGYPSASTECSECGMTHEDYLAEQLFLAQRRLKFIEESVQSGIIELRRVPGGVELFTLDTGISKAGSVDEVIDAAITFDISQVDEDRQKEIQEMLTTWGEAPGERTVENA